MSRAASPEATGPVLERMTAALNQWRRREVGDDVFWAIVERGILTLARLSEAEPLARVRRATRKPKGPTC